MRKLELLIYYRNDYTNQLDSIGVEYEVTDCDKRPMTFYNINAIDICIENGIECCNIHCNGKVYVSSDTYEVVAKKIDEIWP